MPAALFARKLAVYKRWAAILLVCVCAKQLSWCVPDWQEQEDEAQLWKDLKDLQPGEALPDNMPELFYTRLGSLLMCGCYADRIRPFLQEFPRSKYAHCYL